MRQIKRLIWHCSATPADRPLTTAEIRRWHVEGNKWSDIGYHGVLHRNGKLDAARPLHKVGAHVFGHNADSVGLCLVGGADSHADDEFRRHFTVEQLGMFRTLSLWALESGLTVHGHNEFAAKACPGFNVARLLKDLHDGTVRAT